MNEMEKKMLLLFGERDRFFTLHLLTEYLGLTRDPEKKNMVIRVINTVSSFVSDADFMSFMKELRKEADGDAAEKV